MFLPRSLSGNTLSHFYFHFLRTLVDLPEQRWIQIWVGEMEKAGPNIRRWKLITFLGTNPRRQEWIGEKRGRAKWGAGEPGAAPRALCGSNYKASPEKNGWGFRKRDVELGWGFRKLTLNCSDYCSVNLTSTLPSSKIHSAQINSCELRFCKYRGMACLSCLGWGGAEPSTLKGTQRLVTSHTRRIGSPRSASVTTICENPGGTDVRSGLLTSMELEVQKLVWVLKGKVNFVICVSLKTKLSGMLEVF